MSCPAPPPTNDLNEVSEKLNPRAGSATFIALMSFKLLNVFNHVFATHKRNASLP